MRKFWLCMLLFACCICEVKAEGYCVMNGNDGTVIESSNMHETQSVASISKIMTAIIAIEEGNLDDRWLVSDAILKTEGSSIYLQVGQEVSLRDLLYGLMLRSGNDAAMEIAVHIGGDVEHFVQMMNDKAASLGMHDTMFHNPSGLDEADGGNISSAYDMALLMRYAMSNETFAKISGSAYYDFDQNRWQNKNKLLFSYEATTGGKTGYTKKAGRTLVTSASANDLDSIVVTLGVSDDFAFHQTMHEAQFERYHAYTILKKGTYHMQGYTFEIPETISVALPVEEACELRVHTQIQEGQLQVTVEKGEHQENYSFSGVLDQKERSGWFS